MLNVDRTHLEEDMYCEDAVGVHNILLGNDILIIENLINLEKIMSETPRIIALPLNLTGGDGSPVRVVAIQE